MTNDKENFPEYHIWDLKNAISEFIVPRLTQYIKMVESGQTVSLPTWVQPDYIANKTTESELNQIWLDILKEILIPFDSQIHPENYYGIKITELEQRKKRGLVLFAKYFGHLWD